MTPEFTIIINTIIFFNPLHLERDGFGSLTIERDLLGLGLNLSRPSESSFGPDLDDQYTMEVFYRLQLSENLAIIPEVQFIVIPALNLARYSPNFAHTNI